MSGEIQKFVLQTHIECSIINSQETMSSCDGISISCKQKKIANEHREKIIASLSTCQSLNGLS